MTQCIGWIYKNCIYMVADSAVTTEVPASLPSSSFGEVYHKVEGKTVEEGLLKLVCINDNIVIAFSGSVRKATSIIEYIKDAILLNHDIETVINGINDSLGPFDKDNGVSILVGIINNNIPIMYLWNSCDMELRKIEDGVVHIGSTDTFHKELNRIYLSLFTKGNMPTGRLLPIFMSILQSYTVHEYMLNQFIGGIHYGLVLNSDGIMWHEDIKYVLYGLNFSNVNEITCICRDGVVIVRSSITNDTRVLLHSINTARPSEWTHKWEKHINDCFTSGKAKYWVFIGKSYRNITVINMPETMSKSKYFELKYLGDGVFDFAITEGFKELLEKPLIDRNDGSLPFRLTSIDG